jgi:hypothetical protein
MKATHRVERGQEHAFVSSWLFLPVMEQHQGEIWQGGGGDLGELGQGGDQ